MSIQSENLRGRRSRFAALSRRGGAGKVVVIALLIVCVAAGIVGWRVKSSKTTKKVNLIYATAERGTFIHEVTGKGSAESASNVDVSSQVEGTATIIYLIPEGTDVKKGDLLVELDSSAVDEKLDSQVVTTNTSRATLNSSRANLRSAEISLEEYVEGTFEQSWMEYENTIFEAEQTRKQQADSARFTERLLNLNYSTELQYEIDKVAEEKAKNSLEVANLKKMTLLKYTSEKQITSLMSDIETARAKVDSDKNSYNINLSRENRYREISANCKIKAPQDGQVVYANGDSGRMSESDMIKEGSTVYQRQRLVRLPDKTQMQVKAMINESNISSVKVGMPAKISFDSIPNRVIEGEVVKVNLYPEFVWMSSAKDYVTLVKIKEDVPDLRSGLTAQVRIIADEQQDVLMVPVHCVTEYGAKTYCITYNDGVWGYKEVLLGASNEKQVVILDGLKDGDVVVSGARNYRDNVEFPDPSAPSEFEDNEVYQQKLAEAKAEEEKNAAIEAGAAEEGALAGGPGPQGGQPDGPGAGAAPQGGFPGGGQAPQGGRGGFPGGAGGGMPGAGGNPQAMLAALAEQVKAGTVPQEILDKIPPEILASIKNGETPNAEDLEAKHKKMEEAAEYARTIEEDLAHDSEIAAIEPFFERTVMEMQRELLSAISNKVEALQARVASRQNEITRRQEEIELLQKTSESAGSGDVQVMNVAGGEDSAAKIARLTEEIKQLRGDSDLPTLERVVYLDQVDWDKYIVGNDITREAMALLTQESDEIFDRLFPNSTAIDVVKASSDSAEDSEEDEDWMKESEENAGITTADVDYSSFLPLFKVWDTNNDGRLKPTEFVIGFFSDRKSFQNSETDDAIEKLFAEYDTESAPDAAKTERTEIAMDEVAKIADRIMREREDEESGAKRGPRGRRPSRDGAPAGIPGAPNGPDAAAPALPEGDAPKEDSPEIEAPKPEAEAVEVAVPGETPMKNEPIHELFEANSVRQAVALYVDRMDFNGDGLLQKTEFVKGYHDIQDASGKLFAGKSSGSSLDGGSGNRGGGPGGPGGPRPR